MHVARVGRTWPLRLLYVIILTWLAVHTQTCNELQCLNSNPCQSVSTPDNRTHARCLCGGKWAGRRCQHLIHVKPQSVTSSVVQLKVGFVVASDKMTSQASSAMSLVSAEEEEEIGLNYTLVFWKKNDSFPAYSADSSTSLLSSATAGEVTCVLLHGRRSLTPVIEGLLPRTRYTVCIENGFVDSCFLSSFADPSSSSSSVLSSSRSPYWPSNCVTVFTTSPEMTPVIIATSTTVTVVAAISTSILIVLIIVFAIFLVRRQSMAFRLFLDDVICCRGRCLWCCPGGKCNTGEEERTYLGQPSTPAELERTYRFRGDSITNENNSLGRALLERLRPGKRKREVAAPNSVLFLSQSPLSAAFSNEGSLPADDGDVTVSEPEQDPAGVALVTTTVSIGVFYKQRNRLSRKRRGYVAYSARKDRGERLTTVLETPLDEMASAGLMAEESQAALPPPPEHIEVISAWDIETVGAER